MKANQRIAMLLVALLAMMAVTSCGGDNTKAIDAYVEANSTPELKSQITSVGIFSDYSCYRDGSNIVCEYTYVPGFDLSNVPEGYLEQNKSEIIEPIRADYQNNEIARKAIDVMKADNACLRYIYKDAEGHTCTLDIEASDI